MKKIKLSLVAMLATSTMIMAGGDIAPVEAEVVVIPTTKDFYIGFNTELAKDTVWFSDSTIGVQAGWTFFRAGAFDTAVEARYTTNISDAFDTYSYGAFIKPGYSFDVVKAYGLVGYSDSNDNDFSDFNGALTYGGGLSTEVYGYEVFADYLYNDDTYSEVVTVGLNYHW